MSQNPNPVLTALVLQGYNDKIVADGVVGPEAEIGAGAFCLAVARGQATDGEINEMLDALIDGEFDPECQILSEDWTPEADEALERFLRFDASAVEPQPEAALTLDATAPVSGGSPDDEGPGPAEAKVE